MAVTLTDIKICNKAMIRLGVKPFTAFDDGSDPGGVCGETYPELLDAILGMTDWRFATGKRQLNRLTATPNSQYKYAFQFPSDAIQGPSKVFTSASVGAPAFKDWEIFEDKLYTNVEQIFINYRFRPSESKFRPYFTELIVLALAAATAPSLTDKSSLAEEYNARAWGPPSDNMRGGWYAVAAQLNEQESDETVLELHCDLIDARFS